MNEGDLMMSDSIFQKSIDILDGTISDVKVAEHQDGVWFEVGREEYAILSEEEINKLIEALKEARNRKFPSKKKVFHLGEDSK